MTAARMLIEQAKYRHPCTPQCAHRPGTVVEVEPSERVWSTCTRCGAPIARSYENVGDEDRIAEWGPWRLAPVILSL